jgi:2-polyprenyl-3-methyl-5-hydroxy-6-metoxy-1,4-benzoquinol methylase
MFPKSGNLPDGSRLLLWLKVWKRQYLTTAKTGNTTGNYSKMNKVHPKNLEQLKFYDYKEPEYMEYYKNIPYIKYIVKKIITVLPEPRARILEVGAGQGRITFELAKHAGRITAIDISKKEIGNLNRIAKKNRINNVKGEVHDLIRISQTLKKNKYDHIVGVYILHHLPINELPSIVGQLVQYLRPGGRLSFLESNNISPATLLAIMIRKDMTWEVEKGTYTNWVGVFRKACIKSGLIMKISRKFGLFPPELINRYPGIVRYDGLAEKVPILREFLCMYNLLSAQKPA